MDDISVITLKKIYDIMSVLKIERTKINVYAITMLVKDIETVYNVKISVYDDYIIASKNELTIAMAHDLETLSDILKSKSAWSM